MADEERVALLDGGTDVQPTRLETVNRAPSFNSHNVIHTVYSYVEGIAFFFVFSRTSGFMIFDVVSSLGLCDI